MTIARRVEEADADESKLLDKGHHDVGSFHLNSLTIVIKRGSIVGVCGCVGSGNHNHNHTHIKYNQKHNYRLHNAFRNFQARVPY